MIAEQGTPEWENARLGKVTASRLYDIIGTRKDGKPLAARRHYMIELIAERLTHMRADHYLSGPMLFGLETEPTAKLAYETLGKMPFAPAGFIDHPTIPNSGASPDGFVGDYGLVEFKCPESRTHIATLIDRAIPENYDVQMQWQMACRPERLWCDYCTYDPRMPPEFRLAVIRVPKNKAQIILLEAQVCEFLIELELAMGTIMGGQLPYVPPAPPPPQRRSDHLASEHVQPGAGDRVLLKPRAR